MQMRSFFVLPLVLHRQRNKCGGKEKEPVNEKGLAEVGEVFEEDAEGDGAGGGEEAADVVAESSAGRAEQNGEEGR